MACQEGLDFWPLRGKRASAGGMTMSANRRRARKERRYSVAELRARFFPATVREERQRRESPPETGKRLAEELLRRFLPDRGRTRAGPASSQ